MVFSVVMNKSMFLLFILGISFSAQAQTLTTETFGSGANGFIVDFVTITNPGNSADTTGSPNPIGAVSYVYNLGKYEISRGQIEKANAAAGLGITLADLTDFGGNGLNRPAGGISWYEAARFVNWLNTSTGNSAAYKFDSNGVFQLWTSGEAGYQAGNPFRNSSARYFLPTRSEWYKAAYSSPTGAWYDYPTASNVVPTPVAAGTDPGTAVYDDIGGAPADVTNAGALSAFGTMAQGGNVWELTETAFDGVNNVAGENREMRGGGWSVGSPSELGVVRRSSLAPSFESAGDIGFRIAMVPEPASGSLLLLGFYGLMVWQRRSRRV